MTEYLYVFVLGLVIGATFGVVVMALLIAGNDDEDDLCPHGDDWDWCPVCRH